MSAHNKPVRIHCKAGSVSVRLVFETRATSQHVVARIQSLLLHQYKYHCPFKKKMTRDKKTLLRTSIITKETHYMAPSCNGPDVAVLPNNVGSGRSGTIAPTTCPHFQQGRRERPGTAACQDCPPSHEPRCPCTGLLGHRFRPSSGLGELSQEGLCLIRPSSAHLASEHHESGSAKLPCDLGIGPLLPSPCGCQSCPVPTQR